MQSSKGVTHPMPALSARGVCRTYHREAVPIEALRHVDLDIQKGEFVTIMGPSGSGKSTLVHLLSGMDVPDEGTITVFGTDISALSDRARTEIRRQTIGMVFQMFHLLGAVTVAENVAMPLRLASWSSPAVNGRVREVLDQVGLDRSLADRRPLELSGGEQQRVAIARALVANPPILVADEPTGNLDQATGIEILTLLTEFHDDGMTVVLVTHDFQVASVADRAVLLRDGAIAENTEFNTDRHRVRGLAELVSFDARPARSSTAEELRT
jgi:putative ABC transport system ATP-binding protein